jgi:hypothetical protein
MRGRSRARLNAKSTLNRSLNLYAAASSPKQRTLSFQKICGHSTYAFTNLKNLWINRGGRRAIFFAVVTGGRRRRACGRYLVSSDLIERRRVVSRRCDPLREVLRIAFNVFDDRGQMLILQLNQRVRF